ncbi:hypothetical protein HBI55_183430 [Parastagonospora nodorum]|nr:hypothetical protein HBI83_073510 [Parastagonospora nodorum]KAH6487005.1 hypothetical protein HBI55_183430 [Parastagonospora nodorum]
MRPHALGFRIDMMCLGSATRNEVEVSLDTLSCLFRRRTGRVHGGFVPSSKARPHSRRSDQHFLCISSHISSRMQVVVVCTANHCALFHCSRAEETAPKISHWCLVSTSHDGFLSHGNLTPPHGRRVSP